MSVQSQESEQHLTDNRLTVLKTQLHYHLSECVCAREGWGLDEDMTAPRVQKVTK